MKETKKTKLKKNELMNEIRKEATWYLDGTLRYGIKDELSDWIHNEFQERGVSEDEAYRIADDLVDTLLRINFNLQ